MGVYNFIIVLLFNIYWMIKYRRDYFISYNVKIVGWWILAFQGFNLWGIVNLIWYIIYKV